MSAPGPHPVRPRPAVARGVQGAARLGAAVLLAGVAHRAQLASDATRLRPGGPAADPPPDPAALEVAALGQRNLLADLLWMRLVMAFSDVYDAPTPEGVASVGAFIRAIIHLDPGWRSVYFYGGSFLRVLGDLDGSDRVFEAGAAALPEDAYFPFSIGMNAYLHRGSPQDAAIWIERAAELPGAPAWYGAAAAALRREGGGRAAALQYLDEQLARPQEAGVRDALLDKKRELLHEGWEEAFATRAAQLQAAGAPPLARPDDLGALPEDPYGAGWVVGVDGRVRSAHVEARRAERALADERALLLRPGAR
jgi:tetratricopeptide (TPR) repeat protein